MKRKQPSGAAKMKAAGRKPIMLQVTLGEKLIFEEAAKIERRAVSAFITYHALQAARKLIPKV